MIHRYLHQLLTEGVAKMLADPSLLDDLFLANYALAKAEVDSIKTFFATHPPEVINGFARVDSNFPLYAITLSNEVESLQFLADDGGMITDIEDPLYGADIETAIWTHAYEILIYTEHPDVTAYYYEIAKYILLAGLRILSDEGAFEFEMSGGDLAPDPKYLPEHLFARRITFKTDREFQIIDKNSRLFKAFQVSGIHLDRSGSPNDVGDINDGVTTYRPGEDDEF